MADTPEAIGRNERRGGVTRRTYAALQAWLTAIRAEFRVSLSPETPAEARIVAGEIAAIRNASRYHGVIIPIAGIIIALAFSYAVPWTRLLIWWVPMSVLFAGTAWLGRNDPMPTSDMPPPQVRAAAQKFAVVSILLTVAWCAIVPVLWTRGNDFNHVMLVLVITSSMASAASINAAHYASGRICLTIYGLTLTLSPFLVEGGVDPYFVLMAIAFWITMVFQLRANYDVTYRMLSLEDERTGLIDDLTQAKHESDAARLRAEQASLAKSQFLANMSHELRTPLNAILGFSEMISSGVAAAKPERNAEYATLVHESGHHLLALINDILDLAKIESGKLELRESDLDLKSVLCDCVRLMEQKAQAGGIALRSEFAQTLPVLLADDRALRQVVLNLLSNALKFTPPGGEVVAFAYQELDTSITFGVRDSGIGIAEDDQARVFENFGQGRHDVTTSEKGTGLGLAIVKGLIAGHGGQVTLVSRPGEGTCVTAWLPPVRCRAPEDLRAAG